MFIAADAKYYTKIMAAPNPKVWTDFLAVVMKVHVYTIYMYMCTLYMCIHVHVHVYKNARCTCGRG